MNTDFKKLFKRLIIFIFSLILLYPVMVIIWTEVAPPRFKKNLSFQKFASGHSSTRLEEAENTKNVDILFLGSSRSYRHYDPRIFEKEGYNVFNLGTSSQTMIQSEYLVNKFYSQLNPRIVIFDIYPLMFSSDGVESSLDLISNDKLSWKTIDLALQHHNIKVFNTLIYASYYEIFHEKEKEEWYKENKKDTYVPGGYVEREIAFAEVEETAEQKIIPRDSQIESFNRVVEIIQNSGAKLILVQSPMHKGINYSNFEVIDSILENKNFVLNNFKEISKLENRLHFYDPYHLNQKGVEIYNNFFIDQLLKEETIQKSKSVH